MTPIEFDPQTRTFVLSTPTTSYALRVTDDGLRHVHWGRHLTLGQAAAIPVPGPAGTGEIVGEEFPAEGGPRFGPAALVVEFAGGARAAELEYADHEITAASTGDIADATTLRIGLVDRAFPLRLDLYYGVRGPVGAAHGDGAARDDAGDRRDAGDRDDGGDGGDGGGRGDGLDEGSDVLERWATLSHTGAGSAIVVHRFDSAAWTLPRRPDYRLSHVTGEWSAEFALERTALPYGETVATNRRGTTRHQTNPWLAIDPGDATEEHGEVWTVALAWSGGSRLVTRRDLGGNVSVHGGAGHDGGPPRRLEPGESWDAPVMIGAYSSAGFGGASRAFHRYALDHVLPHPDEVRPVLYNSWEGTWFDVTEANQVALARQAADLGVELFVMDDGWFGGRSDAKAGLGDWWPNTQKFPAGLGPLATEVHRLGMLFGIWVEPEMVNPDSDLYRAHPDWVLHMTDRRRTEERNQLVLNFARRDVIEWAYGWLHNLVNTAGIDFFKWDMNRAFTEAGWPSGADPGRLWIDHTRGVYEVIDRLRAAHPGLRIESCASGGGRVDFGIMRRTDQVWTSDNTDPVDRLAIQDGFGQIYPAAVMGTWVTDSPNPITGRVTPLRFRFHSAMAGALGLSGDLRNWSEADRAEAAALIRTYRQIRNVVAHGDHHRLVTGPPVTAVEYVARDASQAVLLALRPGARHGEAHAPLLLRGLDPDATYRDADGNTYAGAVLAHHGIDVYPLMPRGDYASLLLHLRRD